MKLNGGVFVRRGIHTARLLEAWRTHFEPGPPVTFTVKPSVPRWAAACNDKGVCSLSWRKAGIGIGMLKYCEPAPNPPVHPFGGVVHWVLVPSHSAAQNIYPNIPEVLPAPLGGTV